MNEIEKAYSKLKETVASNAMYKLGLKIILVATGIYLTYYLISSLTKSTSGIILIATIISKTVL